MTFLNQNLRETNLTNDKRPIYALTVDEFSALLRGLIQKEVIDVLEVNASKANKQESDIISIQGAMEVTGYKKPTIYAKVHRYEIPVMSRHKPLMFSREELIKWMKSGKPTVIDQQTEAYFNKGKQDRVK